MAAQTSSNANNVDAPDSINAFLARIGGSLLTETEKPSSPASPASPVCSGSAGSPESPAVPPPPPALLQLQSKIASAPASQDGSDSKDHDEDVHSHTRDTQPVPAHTEVKTLEDDLSAILTVAEKSPKGLKDSKHAVASFQPRGNQPNQKHPSSQGSEDFPIGYSLVTPSSSKTIKHEVPAITLSPKGKGPIQTASPVNPSSHSTNTEPFPPFEDYEPEEFVPYNAGFAAAYQSQFCPPHGSNTAHHQLGYGVDSAATANFKECSGDKSGISSYDWRVCAIRKVILKGLPSSADYSAVTSLVHGGSLESIELSVSETNATKEATIVFTKPDAAQYYCAMYPYGVQYKHGSKITTVLVGLAPECEAQSAILQGHLEAGASRVVRVTGADEDWSIRGLCQIAGQCNRKLESINDYWRSEIRTIEFLFTNISDAVHFRKQLLQNIQWQFSNIQFGRDPCEKATGVHLEM